MKRITTHIPAVMFIVLAVLLLVADIRQVVSAAPDLAGPTGLSLSQFKATGSEFVVLTNNTTSTINNLSSYWLYAFNNINPLSTGVSSSSQQLPVASLGAGQAILLSSDGMATCGAAIAGKL